MTTSYRCLILAFSTAVLMPAQPVTTAAKPPPGPPVALAPPAVSLQQAFSDAKQLAKGKNVQAAEDVLTAHNTFRANTPEWHIETSQKLLSTARDLARDGSADAVPGLAAQALHHLDQVALSSHDPHQIGQARACAGYISERLMGDPVAAIAHYEAAAALDPSDQGIRESLNRLQRADALMRAKIHPIKK